MVAVPFRVVELAVYDLGVHLARHSGFEVEVETLGGLDRLVAEELSAVSVVRRCFRKSDSAPGASRCVMLSLRDLDALNATMDSLCRGLCLTEQSLKGDDGNAQLAAKSEHRQFATAGGLVACVFSEAEAATRFRH